MIARACLERFSRLLIDKVKKPTYENGLSYDKKFHYLAHLVFMKVMNPTIEYDELLNDEWSKVNSKVSELKEYYKDYPDEYTLLVAEHEATKSANLTDEEYEAMVRRAFISELIPSGFGNHGQVEFNQEQLAHH
ncbi:MULTISPECIES: hypothetical protein [Lysinibacillus]|nr:hypothetical protein [Lysinibacillus sphaericus]